MPRADRFDLPGTFHHVMNRGARRQPIFLDDDGCLAFLERLALLPLRFGVQVHAYALMPNHFHLILGCPEAGLGRAMQYLQSQYSRWLNASRQWDGPVWRGRYKSRLIDADTYLAHLLAYVHLNPVKARLVPTVEQARWTSHGAYTGESLRPDWLSTSELLDIFGSLKAYRGYLAEVLTGRETGPEDFDPEALWRAPGLSMEPAQEEDERSAAPAWPLGEAEAWQALLVVTGLTRETVEQRHRGQAPNPAWWLAQWWLPRATGEPAAVVAQRMGLHRSALSRAATKLWNRASQDRQVARWVERLESLLPGKESANGNT